MARGNTKKKGKGSQGLNRKRTEDFLEKNKSKSDVVVLDSGLQYTIVDQSGSGEKCQVEDQVKVNQRIWLVDGTVVADTYKGEPDKFLIKEAIEGYQEALMMMDVGDRYKLFVPPELAWGKRGAGNKIGPNATLIIDVRLLEIVYE